MAGDPLRKVLPGQPIQIPAAAVNAWNDAARYVRNQQHNNRTGFTAPVRRADIVRVQNKSGEPRDRFDVLGIDGPIFEPSVSESGFADEVLLIGVKPVATEHSGRFVVLLEPLEEEAIGRAVVAGVVPVRVKLEGEHPEDATGDRFADVLDGDCTRLKSSGFGSAHILWMEPEDEGDPEKDTYWAIVRLGNVVLPAGEGGEADDNAIYGELLSSLPAGGSATMAVLNASGPTGVNVVVHDNLMASGQSLAAGSICWAHWHSVDQRWYVYAVDACPDGDGVVIRNHGDLVGLNGDHHLHYSLRDGSRWTTTQTPSRVVISNVDGHLVCSTITTTELAALEGIAGNIEDRLDALEAGGGTGGFTANRVIISDGSGDLAASDITATELDYLDGVSSNIQTQLDGKADKGHGHEIEDIDGLQDALDGKADSVHSHAISDVTGLSTALAGKADANHTHDIEDIDGLEDALDGKADASAVAGLANTVGDLSGDVTNLTGDLGSLAATVSDHSSAIGALEDDVDALQGALGELQEDLADLEDIVAGLGDASDALTKAVAVVSTSTMLTADHRTILADNAAAITLTMPDAAAMLGDYILPKKISNNTHAVEIDGNGALIDGEPSIKLYAPGDYVLLQSDGTNWHVVGGYLKPHRCVLRRATAKELSSATVTLIDGMTTAGDTAGIADGNQITIRRNGEYLILVSGSGPTFNTSNIWQLYVFVNGNTYGTVSATGASVQTTVGMAGAGSAVLNVGDVIDMRALQYNNLDAPRDLSQATLAVLEQR